MQTLTSKGRTLHVHIEGPEHGSPVLFLNSLGTDIRVWDALLPLLPEGLRVLRLDKPGHGLSDAPSGGLSIEDLADDALALMDAAGVQRATIVGLSIGGLIAQAIAARVPQRVQAIVLMDTASKIGTADIWAERIAALETGGLEGMADTVMTRWFSDAFRAERAAELAVWRNMLVRTTAAGYGACCGAIRDADYRAQAANIACPVLSIGGSEDGSTPPEVVRALAESIPGAAFEEIAGAGHLPGVEAPEAVAAVLNPFLGLAGGS